MKAVLRLPHVVAHIAEGTTSQETPLLVVQSGRLLDANAKARQAGVRPGMALRRARALCPEGRALDLALVPWQERLDDLLAELAQRTPRLETAPAPGAVFLILDLAHLPASTHREVVQEAGRLTYRRTGVAPGAGLARGRFTARVAALLVPPGQGGWVAPGKDRAFLAPFPITTLPLDRNTAHRFHILGLRTLGHLAGLPPSAVLTQFGPHGLFLHRLARGEDDRPVALYRTQPTVRVVRSSDAPLVQRTALDALLTDMAREAHHRLVALGMAARRLRLVLEQEHGGPRGRILALRRPAARAGRLAAVLREMAAHIRLGAGVVAATAVGDLLVPHVGEQPALLPEVAASRPWADLVSDLTARYGRGRFFRVVFREDDALLPEERWRLEEVRP